MAVVFSACNKLEDFGDTNINPNGTTIPNAAALLTNVEAGVGNYGFQTRPGLYAQYFSETQYTDASLYSLPQIDFVGTYTGPLEDLQNIINLNTTKSQTAVAMILKSYILWNLTDQWGDIPYSAALTGGLTAPTYDKQQDIYKGLISDLTTAAASFDGSLISGDIIFKGSQANWIRTANSMRMLMALRLSKRFPAAGGYAAMEFNKALTAAGGIISDNMYNFQVNYPGGNFQNPVYAVYNGREDYGESKTMTDIMGSLGDPRQQAFGGASITSSASSSTGVPYGYARQTTVDFTTANPGWARILNVKYRADNSPIYLITAAQVAFARAEAAYIGWTTETVNTLYEQGINSSFAQWGVADANYLSQSSVALSAGNPLYKIQLQRYIATYPDGMQGWSLWRRTGVPTLTPAPDATNNGQIPIRYRYGQTENSTNPAAVKKAAADLNGGDIETAPLWWDN